jgi:peptidoglycan/xylan/chitin deacetylase (PgdA/CDA1 family)
VVRAVDAIAGAEADVAAARSGLPAGLATGEAIAARLRSSGVEVAVGSPTLLSFEAYLRYMRTWGADSLSLVRARGELASELKIGTWAEPPVMQRVRRRIGLALPAKAAALLSDHAAAGEAAFWRGARAAATAREWKWLTASYSVLVYHRLAGEGRPEQLRIDIPAATFRRQLDALSRARISLLSADDVIGFHRDRSPPARRAAAITVDDAAADTVEPLAGLNGIPAQLFVVPGDVGRKARWLGDTQLASWDELRRLAALGVVVGAHSRSHPPDLTAVDDLQLAEEVAGSRADLGEALQRAPAVFAYPHGRFDERVARGVADAGYAVAYSTQPGLNGLGTDRYALRRISVKAWDTRASIVWKALTGEPVPALWERWLGVRHRLAARRRPPSGRSPS